MRTNVWRTYRNGNYSVFINLENGTKVRCCRGEEMIPEFPEAIDLLISNRCEQGCPFCYAGCTPTGKHGDLTLPDDIHPWTELALNLNTPFHPDLNAFLDEMDAKNVIVNATLNQRSIGDEQDQLSHLKAGVGVSYNDPTEDIRNVLKKMAAHKNLVLHLVVGILKPDDFDLVFEVCREKRIPILLLGYKRAGRGNEHYETNGEEIERNTAYIRDNLERFINTGYLTAFDNLALEDLHLRELLTDDEYQRLYMGDEGQFTMAIDLVNRKYARDSHSSEWKPMGDMTISEMFADVRGGNHGSN